MLLFYQKYFHNRMLPILMGNQHRYLAYMDRFWFKWMKQLIFVSDLLIKNYTNLAYRFIYKDQFHYPYPWI